MKLWRLSQRRSLQRTALGRLRRERTGSRAINRLADLRASAGQLAWRRFVALALLLHLPLVAGLLGEEPPGWLATGWQVSATLVGLGVALIVFLLQAASSQSLSGHDTYRALVARTWIVWPTAFALAFLASVGIVERFGGDDETSAWADTWALMVFVVQIVGFGVAFARAVESVSPAGTRQVLRQAFTDAMNRAVRDDRRRRLMTEDLRRLCEENELSYRSLFARGNAVMARGSGTLVDVDRALPRRLAELGLNDQLRMTLEPGRLVDGQHPLAQVEGVRGAWLHCLLNDAVVIRRREPPRSPVPIFNDVLDVSRRALEARSKGGFRDAIDLIVACLNDLPRIYARWGASYTLEDVYEPPIAAVADEILDGLRSLADDVFRDGRSDSVFLMPQLAHTMVHAGLDEDAWLLFKQGTQLWHHQLRSTPLLREPGLAHQVHEQIAGLGRMALNLQQSELEDQRIPMSSRIAVQMGLRRLFAFQIQEMKLHLDAGDQRCLDYAWRIWLEWGRHWHPEHDVEELELETTIGDARHQGAAAQKLGEARRLLETKRTLLAERARLMFALGAWALHLHQEGRLSAERWLSLVPRLMPLVPDAAAVVDQLRNLSRGEQDPIRNWLLSDWNGTTGEQPPDYWQIARRWAVLVLVRLVQPSDNNVTLGLEGRDLQLGATILDELDALLDDGNPATYGQVVGGRLAERVQATRTAVQKATQRAREQTERHIAQSQLDSGLVDQFTTHLRRVYAEGDYLREMMLRVGALTVLTEPRRSGEPGRFGRTLPKLPFVTTDDPSDPRLYEHLAKLLVRQQLQAAYNALAQLASPGGDDAGPAQAAVQAIAELRRAGHEPDAVLLPEDVYVRALLSSHTEWNWTRHSISGQQERHFATLAGVPVYDPGPTKATALVVCALNAAVRRVERRGPDDASPIHVDVTPIAATRASQLYEAGERAWNVEDRPNVQQAALVRGYVEVHAWLDVEWQPLATSQLAVRRVRLPSRGDRRRAR